MINIKGTFKQILRDWGHDVLLQRRLSDENLFSDRLERVTTRHVNSAARFLGSTKDEETEGVYINSDRIYYFQHNVNPHSGDRVYEENPSPLHKYTTYILEECYPVRGRHGKIEYWMCGASKEDLVA